MNYWLYITNSDNWQITKETNILGASERYRTALSRINQGDRFLVYLMRGKSGEEMVGSHIVAEYEAVSKVFEDDYKIFQAPAKTPSERFHLRIRLEPLRIFAKPIPFKLLVPKLAFIKNKQKWSLHIRGRAVIEIPEHDYRTLAEAA